MKLTTTLVSVLGTAWCSQTLLAQAPLPGAAEGAAERQGEGKQDPDKGERDGSVRVVVTASGFAEQALRTPYTFQTLDQTTMLERGSRTLPEALQYTPGIMIQKTAHGHGSPYIRGFTGRQNLILIDGIRLNNSTFRGGPVQYWNTVDAFAIDHLEVIKSQGSVLYGSDAIGGTVNVFSKSSQFRGESDGQFFHHGSAYYRFETNSISHSGRLEGSIGEGGSWGLFVGVTGRDFGDLRGRTLGRMPQTGYEEFDYDLRLDVAVGDKSTLTIAHQRVQQDDIWRTHRTVFFEPWQGTSLSNPDLARVYDQDRLLSYAKLHGEELDAFVDSYTLTFSFHEQNEDFLRRRTAGANIRSEYDRTEVDTYGLALALESQLGAGTLVYGFDYYRDEVDSSRVDIRTDATTGGVVSVTPAVQGPVGDDATYDLIGAYAQYRLPVTDDLEVTGGARYTYAEADIGRVDDGAGNPISAKRDWDQVTFNLRANLQVAEDVAIYGGASQAFRAPNVDDLSGLKSSRSDLISTGDLNVEPEEYITYELGSRYVTADTVIQGAFFWTDISNLIVSSPVGTVPGTGEIITAATNGSDGYAYGFELEGEQKLDEDWTASGFVAWVDGEADTYPTNSATPVREPLSRLMPLTGSLAVRYQQPRSSWWAGARVTSAARAGRLNSGDRGDTSRFPPAGTPSYVVLQLNGGWQASEHLEFFVTLDNVTNTSYRVHGSGVNEAGFNAILGGRLSW